MIYHPHLGMPRCYSSGRPGPRARVARPQERQLTSEEITPLTELERDALCELANVAMSRAATSLRQMVRRQILLSAPTCEILATETAVERLTKPGNPDLVAVRQDFTGAFSGRALLIFPERGSLELMRAHPRPTACGPRHS